MKSDHPAVVRTRPRNTVLNNSTFNANYTANSGSVLYTTVEQNGVDNDYIIPLPDPKPEGANDMPQEASSSRARYQSRMFLFCLSLLHYSLPNYILPERSTECAKKYLPERSRHVLEHSVGVKIMQNRNMNVSLSNMNIH